MKKLIISASMVGTVVEWYDVFIFSSGASYIGAEIFPSKNPLASELSVLLVFALGFITRPLGAILFGHLGDKGGRTRTLMFTLFISGFSSGLIGLLPTYAQAGDLSILGLTSLRLILGLGLGGEWGGAVLLMVENSGKRRSFYSSFVQSTVGIGLLMGSIVFLILSSLLPKSQMYSYGWRIPFLLSFLMAGIGLLIRAKVDETPLFRKAKESGVILDFPLAEMVGKWWRQLLLGTVVAGSLGTIFYVGAVLLPLVYKSTGVIGAQEAFLGTAFFASIEVLSVFLGGFLGDKIGRRTLVILSNFLALLSIYPAFLFRDHILFFIFMGLYGIYHGLSYSPLAALVSEVFPTNVRYTGSSSAYQFGNSFIGGPASYVSAYLGSFDLYLYPVYAVVLSLITIGVVYKSKETKDVELTAGELTA